MTKQSTLLLLGLLAAGALETRAQTAASATPPPAAPPSWDVALTPSYVSTYMFRGQRLSGQAIQPELDATYGAWDVGIWTSTPLNGESKVPGQSDPEIDPYASYTYTINGSLNLQPGFTWYTYANAPTVQGFYRQTFEPNLALNYTVGGLKIAPKLYYDVILGGPTYELNATYAIPPQFLGTEVDLIGTAGTFYQTSVVNHTGPQSKAWGNYYLLGVNLPYQITKRLKAAVGWAYTAGDGEYIKIGSFAKYANPDQAARGVFSGSLSWSF